MDVVIKAGDTWPLLTIGDPPLDLAGATATYRYISRRNKPVSRPLRIAYPEKGQLALPSRAPVGVRVEIVIELASGHCFVLPDRVRVERREP